MNAMRITASPWLGAALLVAALPGAWMAPRVFFAAWLAACWFALGLVLGALSWLWIHRLSGGRWGAVLRADIVALAARLPRVLLLFVPVALGARLLYPWLDAAPRADEAPLGHAFLAAWHSPAFVAARLAIYAVIWLALARAARRSLSGGGAAASLLLHLTVTSLAAVDVLASLVAGWSSSVFGLVTLAGQAFGGGALVVALACRRMRVMGVPRASEDVPLTRDFGNLLLTAALLWGYLAFVQLLIIWAENLPREISWYVPRLQTGWLYAGVALVVLHLALPTVLLVFRILKDAPQRLERIALAMLAAHALDVAWLVVPSVAPHALAAWWLTPLLTAALPLLAFGRAGAPLAPSAPPRCAETVDVAA